MPWDEEEGREISRRKWFVKHWFGRPYLAPGPIEEPPAPRRTITEQRTPVRLGGREYIWRNYEVSPEVGEGIRDYIKTSFQIAGERMQDPVYAALAFGPGTIKEIGRKWYRSGGANEYSEFTFDPSGKGLSPRMSGQRGSGVATGQYSYGSPGEGRIPVSAAENPLKVAFDSEVKDIQDLAISMMRLAEGAEKGYAGAHQSHLYLQALRLRPKSVPFEQVQKDIDWAIETWRKHRQVHPMNILLKKWGHDGIEYVGEASWAADSGTFGNVKFPPMTDEGKVIGLKSSGGKTYMSEDMPAVAPIGRVIRAEGVGGRASEAIDNLDAMTRKDYVYRGMTEAEFENTVARGKGIKSRKDYSFAEEGTSFAEDVPTAESYVNYGRDDPRITGKPTYLVEVKKGENLKLNRQGYYYSDHIPQHQISRIWKMEGIEDEILAIEMR